MTTDNLWDLIPSFVYFRNTQSYISRLTLQHSGETWIRSLKFSLLRYVRIWHTHSNNISMSLWYVLAITFCDMHIFTRNRDCLVGVATGYGLEGSGIESRWSEICRTRSDRPWGPPSLLYNGYRVFPGGKAAGARGCPLTSFYCSAEVKKE
jgi:hypothetical protein